MLRLFFYLSLLSLVLSQNLLAHPFIEEARLIKRETEAQNRIDIQTLQGELSPYKNKISFQKTRDDLLATLKVDHQTLKGILSDRTTPLMKEVVKRADLLSGLERLSGVRGEYLGLYAESQDFIRRCGGWDDLLSGTKNFFPPTWHNNHMISVHKTTLIYLATLLNLSPLTRLNLSILYPCSLKAKEFSPLQDLLLYDKQSMSLYIPNSGYVFGGVCTGAFHGTNCSGFVARSLGIGKQGTAQLITLWKDLQKGTTTSKRWKAITFPSKEKAIDLLQEGDVVVWPGHVSFFISKMASSTKNNPQFLGIEANRADDGHLEGILERPMALFRKSGETYILRPLL